MRSLTLTPRIRLAGLLLMVSVRLLDVRRGEAHVLQNLKNIGRVLIHDVLKLIHQDRRVGQDVTQFRMETFEVWPVFGQYGIEVGQHLICTGGGLLYIVQERNEPGGRVVETLLSPVETLGRDSLSS